VGWAGAKDDEVSGWQHTQTLFSQGDPLQLLQTILLGDAVDDRVLEEIAILVVEDGGLQQTAALVGLLNLPRVTLLVVDQARIVVALVHVLEDRAEDLGLLLGEMDTLAARGIRLHVHGRQRGLEPG
jgi:hypothetical protein